MSSLRLLRAFRALRTPQNTKTMSSHFFFPSPSPRHLGLPLSRFYSRGSGGGYGTHSQATSNMTVLYTLMGTNIAIFSYAMYLKVQATQGFSRPFTNFMRKMTLNLTEFRNGAYQTIVTSMFTHADIGHVLSNMVTVYFLGSFLAQAPVITPGRYLIIALGSGISGSVGYLYNRYLQTTKNTGMPDNKSGLGFSGAVMGISTVAACLAPQTRVAIWGIIPMPLWALVTGYAVYDGYYINNADSRIAHAGHLGGLAFGLLYYFARLRGVRY
ncbi:hypothetical protein EJ02DRAFT_450373 [Clathrospora elynae]|uniref:Peptidase S54 rhomboid domain-containing protein n=1 Tax=Clathrospora elynae TaxID=706981 RepID=A0A6A5T0Y9_9PLEO|nr:hypothetical protein EJ02DRAFT_450373 [Clathrospora elynae]